jgi:FkbM family methyltransferase
VTGQFRTEHFGIKHKLVAFISQKLFGNFTYTVRHGLARGMRRKGGLGFLPVSAKPTEEEVFLGALPLEGKVVYDIGAFEGLLTLYFSRRAKQVIAFEPNPRNRAKCLENLRLNKIANVRLINEGVSNAPGTVTLVFDPLMPGAGTVDESIAQQISSSVDAARTVEITVLPLDEHLHRKELPPPDLIKIDIEGLEFQALQGMEQVLARYSPGLYIEMHGATVTEKLANAQAVVGFLDAHGYGVFDVENKRYLTPANLGGHRPSHLYCTRTLRSE